MTAGRPVSIQVGLRRVPVDDAASELRNAADPAIAAATRRERTLPNVDGLQGNAHRSGAARRTSRRCKLISSAYSDSAAADADRGHIGDIAIRRGCAAGFSSDSRRSPSVSPPAEAVPPPDFIVPPRPAARRLLPAQPNHHHRMVLPARHLAAAERQVRAATTLPAAYDVDADQSVLPRQSGRQRPMCAAADPARRTRRGRRPIRAAPTIRSSTVNVSRRRSCRPNTTWTPTNPCCPNNQVVNGQCKPPSACPPNTTRTPTNPCCPDSEVTDDQREEGVLHAGRPKPGGKCASGESQCAARTRWSATSASTPGRPQAGRQVCVDAGAVRGAGTRMGRQRLLRTPADLQPGGKCASTLAQCAEPNKMVGNVCCTPADLQPGGKCASTLAQCTAPNKMVGNLCCTPADLQPGGKCASTLAQCTAPNKMVGNVCCTPADLQPGGGCWRTR